MCQYTSILRRSAGRAIFLAISTTTACQRGSGAPGHDPRERAIAIAITNVGVFDPVTGRVTANRTVLVTGRRIVDVAAGDGIVLPPGTARVDGRGATVIPGLWDMHVHLTLEGADMLPDYVAHGITTVRDMGGESELVDSMRREVERGARIGPRVLTTSPQVENAAAVEGILQGASPDDSARLRRDRIVISTPAEAARAVDSLSRLGVRAIKARDFADAATYWALASGARSRGMTLVGHAPFGLPVDARALADSGQRTIEHWYFPTNLMALPVPERDSIVAAYARHRVALDPTLGAWRQHRFTVDSLERMLDAARRDPRAKYATPALFRSWTRDLDARRHEVNGRPATASELAGWNRVLDTFARESHTLLLAGMPILAGSDIPFARLGGDALHDELALLVREGGFTPAEALTAATLAPARAAGVQDSLGVVAAGMIADLVLLDADPSLDIGAVTRVRAVMRNGRWMWRRPR